eukprot:6014607-Pyramimonas_sp.AAC.1
MAKVRLLKYLHGQSRCVCGRSGLGAQEGGTGAARGGGARAALPRRDAHGDALCAAARAAVGGGGYPLSPY